ncbi:MULTISPECIES: hypothetical protein [Streptomycetaceae]|uniref:Uncharacterized protein n=1 Tax=Streptantibioticus cattleyicolor (strain ATCC 35852 / DSM 46488 / JCM 4925 / NBRC 14057 / NRRL 8057) TaxID=1003195 RepID=F8JW38_STREN|nr:MULTISPECIES: hypothetical protein [Streptomycetaceae]AEW93206.1 hypothetical protein SCATT_08350 [Streptantibioticus cattleyicolor NRRL 8057 = DSM 46488]MYS57930.1 hypothetical protein [Streptomyces sp. SID5468]CCB73569.1 protein of unknown function [Streptantibioticus cattleyicolor NRRL 8057 = DSM 46488]
MTDDGTGKKGSGTGKKAGAVEVVGWVVTVQGFGSALTEAVWHHSFGVTGLISHVWRTPWWAGLLVGCVGVALVVAGRRRTA